MPNNERYCSFSHSFLQKIATYHNRNALIYQRDGRTYRYDELLSCVQRQIALLDSFSQNSVQESIDSKPSDYVESRQEHFSQASTGIQQGSILAIIGDFTLECIAMLLAALEKRLIVVPLIEDAQIDSKLQQAQVEYVYHNGILKARTSDDCVDSKHSILMRLIREGSSGLILFSSGSTGKPKAIAHNLSSLADSYCGRRQKDMSVLLFLMFDHIGGLHTLLHVLSVGACGIVLSNRKDLYLLAKAVEMYRVSLLPASPSLLNLLLVSGAYKQIDMSSLRFITYGTESMPDSLLAKLKLAFPKARFHQTFGTSEVGIMQTTSKNNAFKLEGVAYKIIDKQLYIKSSTQSLGYLNADNNVFDNEGYFATGDLVEQVQIHNEEYLRVIGRAKEVINIGGEKLIPQEVEGVLLQIPFIKDCLVYGELSHITGQIVCAKIVLDRQFLESLYCEDSNNSSWQSLLSCGGDNIAGFQPNVREIKKALRLFCQDKIASFKIPSKIEIVESLAISQRFKKIRNNHV